MSPAVKKLNELSKPIIGQGAETYRVTADVGVCWRSEPQFDARKPGEEGILAKHERNAEYTGTDCSCRQVR